MIGSCAIESADPKREDRIIAVPTGFKCLVCRRIFPTELEGLKHVKSSHSKTYSCPQCGRTFNNKARFVILNLYVQSLYSMAREKIMNFPSRINKIYLI